MKLSLSDTLRSYDFLGGNDIYVKEDGIELPLPAREDTFAESADSEGRWRVRSRAQNAEGAFVVFVTGSTSATFWDNVDNLLELVESAHKRKGTITYQPPNGEEVTWDLQSISVTGLPQRGVTLRQNIAECEISFECRPYGRLAEVNIGGYLDVAKSLNPAVLLALDATNGVTDLSGNGRNGTGSGGITIGGHSPGPLAVGDDGATDFDNTDDKVTITGYNPFVNGTTRTFTAWVYRDNTSTNDSLFGAPSGYTSIPMRFTSSSTILLYPNGASGASWTDSLSGQWVHYALVFDEANDQAWLYRNGALHETVKSCTTAWPASVPSVQIGAELTSTTPWDGKVMGVAIYERGLTADEIADLYGSGAASWTLDGPVDDIPVAGIPGQLPAWGNLTLTDASSQDRYHVEVGVQDDYDPENPEPLLLQAVTDLSALAGSSNTRSGSYSTNILRAGLTTSAVAVCETGDLAHKGKWKLRTRVYASATGCRVRLSWRTGTAPWAAEKWVSVPGASNWYDLDLGTLDIPELTGTHTFQARVEAACTTGVPTIDVDTVTLIPADRYLRVRGTETVDNATAPVAVDDFDSHSSGALASLTPPLVPAGTWTGAGDSDDFTVDSSLGQIYRTTSAGDSSILNGRFARCGSGTLAAVSAQVWLYVDDTSLGTADSMRSGLLLRYTNTSNFLIVYYDSPVRLLNIVKVVSGTPTTLGTAFMPGYNGFTLLAGVDTSGNVIVYTDEGTGWIPRLLTLADSDLATSGTLQTGGYGIYDAALSGFQTIYRYYDNFSVSSPSSTTIENPAIHSDEDLAVLHNAALTTSSDGATQAPSPIREGNYLKLLPATRSEKTSRIVVNQRRTDIQGGGIDGNLTDDLTATLSVTPRVHLGKP